MNQYSSRSFNRINALANSLATDKGWYLPGVFTRGQISIILELYEKQSDQEIIDLTIKYCIYESQSIKYIEFDLIKDNPTRENFIKDGIWAHNQQKHSLSTMSFIQQADGIVHDYLKSNLFHSFNEKKFKEFIQVAKQYDQLPQQKYTLLPISHYPPLYYFDNIKKHNIFKGAAGLQRSNILHGNDKEYDTELNSLKALLFLSSLSSVLKIAKNWKNLGLS